MAAASDAVLCFNSSALANKLVVRTWGAQLAGAWASAATAGKAVKAIKAAASLKAVFMKISQVVTKRLEDNPQTASQPEKMTETSRHSPHARPSPQHLAGMALFAATEPIG
jgi:hypothetical protein